VRVAPALIPAIADRPLVMKRFPNGVAAQPFYQHAHRRSARRAVGSRDRRRNARTSSAACLKTCDTTQLAAISQDRGSRVPEPEFADCAAFDLDPSEGVSKRSSTSRAGSTTSSTSWAHAASP
jgi:bifunctional non-homologous end joining protein LigD